MPLTKLQFKPGINREVTAYSNEGGWVDCDKIRFRFGYAEKFGGWEKLTTSTYEGTARRLHNWLALDGSNYLGVGTHLKYYIEEGGLFNDITPIRASTTNSTTFSATNGSANITVTENSHGAAENDFVTFSNAVSLGHFRLFEATIPSGTTITLTAATTAGSAGSYMSTQLRTNCNYQRNFNSTTSATNNVMLTQS